MLLFFISTIIFLAYFSAYQDSAGAEYDIMNLHFLLCEDPPFIIQNTLKIQEVPM